MGEGGDEEADATRHAMVGRHSDRSKLHGLLRSLVQSQDCNSSADRKECQSSLQSQFDAHFKATYWHEPMMR
jgi:hypothetical protein